MGDSKKLIKINVFQQYNYGGKSITLSIFSD